MQGQVNTTTTYYVVRNTPYSRSVSREGRARLTLQQSSMALSLNIYSRFDALFYWRTKVGCLCITVFAIGKFVLFNPYLILIRDGGPVVRSRTRHIKLFVRPHCHPATEYINPMSGASTKLHHGYTRDSRRWPERMAPWAVPLSTWS
jgi:hypothetical protein